MKPNRRLWQLIIFVLASILYTNAIAVTQIQFWHSMGGHLGSVVNRIVDQFNQRYPQYHIDAIYKGNYNENLTSTVAAFRAGKQPTLVQVFEVGTETMINPKGVIVPVYQLMQHFHIAFSGNDFIPAIHSYYANSHGQLLGMPFNSSAAVLFYNKDMFKHAGLNPAKPPCTWPQVAYDSQRLLKSGYRCGFTTAWPSWIQIETLSAWHNHAVATQNNGFSGENARMIFNNPLVIRQIASLAKWQRNGIFHYGGREDNAYSLFTSQQCAMLLESSATGSSMQSDVHFHFGTGTLPYWPDVKGAPQNAIIGGAAIWVLTGKSNAEYRGAATFLKYLSSPAIQSYWQKNTGYVPVTVKAYQLSKRSGFYQRHPSAEIAIKELNNKPPKPYTKGLRLGNYSSIRDINCEEIENALTGSKTAKQAMDDAVTRDNRLLKQYQENLK